jgi:hypothetical protein
MESEMYRIQRLALLSSAIALLTTSVCAAPGVPPAGGLGPIVQAQYRSNYGMSGLGGFWGNGPGFGGGGYSDWPTQPAPQPPPPPAYRPPVYSTYQPPPQPAAPVIADVPDADARVSAPTSIRRTTYARPIPNAQANYLATLSGVSGDDVSVRAAGGVFANVSSGRQLRAADEVASGPDTEVTLTLRDGSTVRLSPATQIDLAALDSRKDNTKALVALKIGEISSRIGMGATISYNFGVKTDRATFDVREASFTVRQEKDTGMTTVSVDEGAVLVSPANMKLAPVTLRANQQAVIGPDSIDAPVSIDASAADVATAPTTGAGTNVTAAEAPATVIPASTGAKAGATVGTSAEASSPTAVEASPAASGGQKDAEPQELAAAVDTATPPKPVDLSGRWLTQDGSVVQLTQIGSEVSWKYRGAAGHETQVGTITATFDGKYLAGIFRYKEGDTEGNGTVTMTMDNDRLVGGWVSTEPPGKNGKTEKTTLTRQ